MRYTRNALGLLNAQYRSVLKKCLLVNLGLFALGASISTADAAVTLSPTLDSLKEQAKDISTTESHDLTKLNSGETLPEDAVKVTINKETYYFTPSSDKDLLQTLAGTSAGIITSEGGTPKSISFDVSKLPASVFSYKTGTENDYNFVVQEAGQDGKLTPKYYKIVLKTNEIGTSKAIKWSTEPAGATGSVDVKLPNSDTPTKLYYTVDEPEYNSTPSTRFDNLTSDVGSATQKVLFKGLNQTSASSKVEGGAIYNTSNDGYNIYADFIGNYTSATAAKAGTSSAYNNIYAYGGAIYNNGTIGNITGDFIGNYTSATATNSSSARVYAYGGAIYNSSNSTISNITGDFIGNYASAAATTTSSSYVYANAYGGAIYNNGTIGNITGDFIGNYTSATTTSTTSDYNNIYAYAYGGAIYNGENGTIGNITGDFIGNYTSSHSSSSKNAYANAYGGAIYNDEKGTIGNITGDFIGNYTSATAAKAGTSSDYNIIYAYAYGGAIYNKGTIGNITGDFIGNYTSATASSTFSHQFDEKADAYGGAIYNDEKGTIGNITGDFIGNYTSATAAKAGTSSDYNIIYAYAYGGAIYNKGTIGNITGDFIGNYTSATASSTFSHQFDEKADAYGGAIYNDEKGTIGNITGDFIGNYASSSSFSTDPSHSYGGAIYNGGTISNIIGDFIGNYASATSSSFFVNVSVGGGAIDNNGTIGNITGDFIGNYASATVTTTYYYWDKANAYGGAISSGWKGTIGNITGDFIGNYATATASSSFAKAYAYGGAIDNNGTIGNITGDFIGNYASSFNLSDFSNSSNVAKASGGAIYNYGTIDNISGDFTGNYASATATNSSSAAYGGAIYNLGTLTIAGASTFTDNYVEVNGVKTSNAIHNNGVYGGDVIINFNSGNIVINDAITGENYKSGSDIYKSVFNFAGQQTATSDNDVITLNNSLTNTSTDETLGNIEVNLTKGTLKLGHYKSALLKEKYVGTFGEGVDFNVTGGKLTTQDGITDDHNLGNLKLSADLNTSIDVDLSKVEGDVLTGSKAATSTEGKKILIDNIKVLADGTSHIVKVKVADANIKDVMDLANDVNIVMNPSDTNSYLVVYEKDADFGNLKFGNVKALETAVQLETASNKVFAMGSDISTDTDLGALTGASLSISGSGHTIDGNNKKGMTIAGGQTVSLNDVTVKGFDGAFAENNGTMNIAAGAGNELNLNSGISGSGDINAKGEGKLNINSNIAANKMTVLGGELNLKSGSELANVEKFVANGGVLNVGDQTVNLKKAEFNDGSTLAINVKSDGNGLLKADSLTVNGGQLKATLGQGIVDMQNQHKTVTLLESGTEFVNKFADVADNNMYRFEKADKAGDYIISLAKTAEDVSQENGGTQNNAGEAKAWVDGNKFEQGSVSADVADKLADLAQNDAKGFNEALSALAPSDNSEVRTNSVNHNTEMFRAVVSHLDDVSKKNQYGLSSGDAVDGVSVWAKAFGNHAKVDNTSKAYGFKSDGYGATLGIEKQLDDAFKVGLGYSYFYDDVDGFMRDSDVNTHTGFVYGEYRPNNWYTNAIASYGYSKYDENKHVAGDVYKAKYDVDNIGAQVMTGYNASVAKVDVTPEAGLRYNNIHRDNYVDSAGQAVKAETMDVMTAVAGLKVGKDLVSCFGLHEVYWRPEARLAATYDLISDKENAVVSLSNGSGYVVKGQRLNRFGVETGAGVTFYLSPDVESSVGYEGKFRSHYQDHTGYVSAKYKF